MLMVDINLTFLKLKKKLRLLKYFNMQKHLQNVKSWNIMQTKFLKGIILLGLAIILNSCQEMTEVFGFFGKIIGYGFIILIALMFIISIFKKD